MHKLSAGTKRQPLYRYTDKPLALEPTVIYKADNTQRHPYKQQSHKHIDAIDYFAKKSFLHTARTSLRGTQ